MPYLTLGSKRIHYTSFTPPPSDTPPKHTFLFHHGLGSSQNFFAPVIPALLAHNIQCIAFDTSGAGRSPPTGAPQSVATLAADALAVLDALAVPQAVVVGHSMGGLVAAELAARHGARVAATVWVGPVRPAAAAAAVFDARRALVRRDGGLDELANSIPSAATGSAAGPLARAFVRELILAQDPVGYAAHCEVIRDAQLPAYAEIRCPVLILAGEEDRSAPLEGCKAMFEELQTEKELVVLPGVGHWHCIEVSRLGRSDRCFAETRGRRMSKWPSRLSSSTIEYNSLLCTWVANPLQGSQQVEFHALLRSRSGNYSRQHF